MLARRRSMGSVAALLAVALLVPGAAMAESDDALPPESEQAPATDCTAPVGYNQNRTLPGYIVPDEVLGTTCVPFTQVPLAPADYEGDFRVAEFSDDKLRELLAQCEANPPCTAIANAQNYVPPQFRVTGTIVSEGLIDPHDPDVDLSEIRRPSFFADDPYNEAIAKAEDRTYTFEFTVPAEPFERINRGITDPVKLRGWYVNGAGVPDGQGRRVRALAIFVGGRSIETTAVEDRRDPVYTRSTSTGRYVGVAYPARGTEHTGMRAWRQYLYKLNQAGFDVLTFDKRGHGISGGISGDNVFQQGLDMLRAIDTLGSGEGLRTLGPDGVERTGQAAVRALLPPGQASRIPIVLGGPSQGSAATMWAMDANFNRWCELDLEDKPCHDPWGHDNVRGAALLASFPVIAPNLLEAARRKVNHTVWLFTSSEPLAGMGSWPAAFFGKGVWDEIQGPFPTFNAYLRIEGMKELLFVRGPHAEQQLGPGNVALMQDRVAGFAVNAVLGRPSGQPEYQTLKEAIAAGPQIWEVSTQPTFETSP